MKKTDIALLIIIVAISAGLSYWIASITIGRSSEEPIVVRTVEEIVVDEGVAVDEKVFAEDGINPTVEATISGDDITSFIDTDSPAVDTTIDGDDGSTNGAQ